MTLLPHLQAAANDVQKRLDAVAADQWSSPTPCDEWTVQDLAGHLLGGALMPPILLAGGTKADVEAVRNSLIANPETAAADFAAATAKEQAAFANASSLDNVVDHPALAMPGSMMLMFKVADYLGHAWDLSRALNVDDTLDPGAVEALWAELQPLAAILPSTGVFGTGASGEVADDAPLQVRLLDLMGRRS